MPRTSKKPAVISETKSRSSKSATGKPVTAAFIITLIAALMLVVSGAVWWQRVRNDPYRLFYRMLGNSMAITSVTRHIVQEDATQKVDESVQLLSAPVYRAHSVTSITQKNQGGADIKTEAIGTPGADYARYTSINTSQKGRDGNPLDFSPVLNVWGKTEGQPNQTNGQLFNEMTLGVVPMGFVTAREREAIVAQAKADNVYGVNVQDGVTRSIVAGKPQYTYKLKVKPEAYVAMLKRFGMAIGLTQLKDVDPSSYKNEAPLDIELTIDVRSANLVSLSYVNSERKEWYESYGALIQPLTLPENAIDIQDLQSRLQSIQ